MQYFVDLFNRYVPRGSTILAITTFGSYVFGLLRDRIFAQTFGASAALDSYNAAFLIPDFLFNLLVASGIAAAAVPLFTELRSKNHKLAHEYISALLVVASAVMLVAGVFVALFAPQLSLLVAPGLAAVHQETIVILMRILAVSPILFAISNTFGAMLVSQKRFLFYGLSPIFYNLGIISGALWLTPVFGVVGIAYGTLLGAFLHMACRAVDSFRSGFRVTAFAFPMKEMKRTLKLMLPKMIGHPVELLTFWVFTSIASLLSVGSITVLNFARNFQSVPVSILGITMSTAVFPSLAEAALSSKKDVRQLFKQTAGVILLVSLVAALAMFVIKRPLVQILLGGGAFDEAAVARTALTLGVFCLAIPTESLNHLFARSFYATQNTVIPVLFSVISLVLAGGAAYYLSQSMGIVGIPLGFFLGSATKTVGLFILFLRRVA